MVTPLVKTSFRPTEMSLFPDPGAKVLSLNVIL
jgi:hypothetical protein